MAAGQLPGTQVPGWSSSGRTCPSSRLLPFPDPSSTNFWQELDSVDPLAVDTRPPNSTHSASFHSLPEITFDFGFLCCALLPPGPRSPPLICRTPDHPFPHLGQRSSLLRFVTSPATSVTLYPRLPRIGPHFTSLDRACPHPVPAHHQQPRPPIPATPNPHRTDPRLHIFQARSDRVASSQWARNVLPPTTQAPSVASSC